MDDAKFDAITYPQWIWYSQMLAQDQKNTFDQQLSFTEYLASFWNAEAVKNIRDSRAQAEQHAFQSDEEFEKSVLEGSYKNNPLLEAIQKIREAEKGMEKINPRREKIKAPTDLAALSKLIKKF